MDKVKWERLYEMIGELTPLTEDCGRLCGKKCCSEQGGGPGVYLFPGEERMFAGEAPWYRIEEHPGKVEHFTGRKPLLFNCRAKCPREKRPLACRLFPLAPRLDQSDSLEIVLDVDALFICPLVRMGYPGALNPAFAEAVRRVWLELLGYGPVRDSVREYSARIDREAAEPWRRLLG
ncbi:MAG: hypothetical protein ACOY40_16235 [Bacillota bacterium]